MDQKRDSRGKGLMGMCGPMMARFMGGAGTSRFGRLLMIPGLLLILGGVLILAAPMVLVWLIAGGAIVMGVGIVLAPVLIRSVIARKTGARSVPEMPMGKTSGSGSAG